MAKRFGRGEFARKMIEIYQSIYNREMASQISSRAKKLVLTPHADELLEEWKNKKFKRTCCPISDGSLEELVLMIRQDQDIRTRNEYNLTDPIGDGSPDCKHDSRRVVDLNDFLEKDTHEMLCWCSWCGATKTGKNWSIPVRDKAYDPLAKKRK